MDCICPIWYSTETGIPELWGTSTLIDFGVAKYLVTAAHVADKASTSQLYVNGGERLIELTGTFLKTQLPRSGDRKDDLFDLAWMKVEAELNTALTKSFWFLPSVHLNPLDRLLPGKHYTFSGYPVSKSDTHIGPKKVTGKRWIYTSVSVPLSSYRKEKIDPSSHIAIEFNRTHVKDQDGKRVQAPLPNGISGGPIWSVERHPIHTKTGINLRLAGIATDYREQQKLIFGVRINFFLEWLRRSSPELSPYIPIRSDINIQVSLPS